MLKNPENYEDIQVVRDGSAPLGSKDIRKWAVAGLKTYEKPGYIGSFVEWEVLQGGFANRPVAEYWMKQYLEMYVSVVYFPDEIVDEDLYAPLDSNN